MYALKLVLLKSGNGCKMVNGRGDFSGYVHIGSGVVLYLWAQFNLNYHYAIMPSANILGKS